MVPLRHKFRGPRPRTPVTPLGRHLVALMQERGLSQNALARAIGVNPSQINNVLVRGNRKGSGFSLEMAGKIAHALGITLDELYPVSLREDALGPPHELRKTRTQEAKIVVE